MTLEYLITEWETRRANFQDKMQHAKIDERIRSGINFRVDIESDALGVSRIVAHRSPLSAEDKINFEAKVAELTECIKEAKQVE